MGCFGCRKTEKNTAITMEFRVFDLVVLVALIFVTTWRLDFVEGLFAFLELMRFFTMLNWCHKYVRVFLSSPGVFQYFLVQITTKKFSVLF